MSDSARSSLAGSRLPLSVLLVDDHSLFTEGLSNLLATEDIRVLGVARDGFEALEQARRLHPDVILMDVKMPNCNGLTATRLIKAEMPECKIVMLTMSEDEQDLFEAVKSGASGYLLKNLDAARFFKYLAELRAGHAPFSPGLAEKVLREFAQQATRAQAESPPVGSLAGGSVPHQAQLCGLSPRQTQILALVAQGQTYREVAETIGIAERTVKYHLSLIHI